MYSAATDAYRDTVKWLTSTTPVAALIAAIVTGGSSLVSGISAAPSFGSWLGEHPWTAVAGGVAVLAAAAVICAAGLVLTAKPMDLGELTNDTNAPEVSPAFGDGVGVPYYFDRNSFNAAMNKANLGTASDEDLKKLEPVIRTLRDWSLYRRTRHRFGWFIAALAAMLLLSGLAILALTVGLSGDKPVTSPTEAAARLSPSGQQALEAATGCTALSSAYIVGGTWSAPELLVDGASCRFGATWWPGPGDAIVVPKPAP